MPPSSRHVVFGAGQVGPALALRLVERGHEVTIVSRSGRGACTGVAVVAGNALDAAFCTEPPCSGAAVVYHCMNPKYQAATLAAQLPRSSSNLIAACGAAGARLVVLDNLYALGRTGGGR